MEIVYTEERRFTAEDLRELFGSVGWLSGKYPERLKKALDGCATVITAWEGEKLVGLVNAIDDGELTALRRGTTKPFSCGCTNNPNRQPRIPKSCPFPNRQQRGENG